MDTDATSQEPGDTRSIGVRGSNQSGMRDRNERLVLSLVRRHGALAKAEIARMTGLSAQTVSVIMRALENDGLLSRGEKVRGKVGQPSVPMKLNPEGAFFFGLKIGRRSADLVLIDFLGAEHARVHETYRFPTPDGTLQFAQRAVEQLTAGLTPDQASRIAGLGIAIPFFLWEWASVIGIDESEMSAWRQRDLGEEITALFDFPVFVENDATCACGAELVFGTANPPPDFLYIYLGYFIGGGVVLNNHLYTGPSGNAGALGPLPTQGSQLVDRASLVGLEKMIVEAGGDAASLWETSASWSISEKLIDAWFDASVPAMSHAIISAISVIDFQDILIDGWLPQPVLSKLVQRLNDELDGKQLSGLTRPTIRAGTVGADARSLGAASLPLSKKYLLEA